MSLEMDYLEYLKAKNFFLGILAGLKDKFIRVNKVDYNIINPPEMFCIDERYGHGVGDNRLFPPTLSYGVTGIDHLANITLLNLKLVAIPKKVKRKRPGCLELFVIISEKGMTRCKLALTTNDRVDPLIIEITSHSWRLAVQNFKTEVEKSLPDSQIVSL